MAIHSLLQRYLDSHHAPYATIAHRPAFTAQELAAVERVPGTEHAKVVMLKSRGRLVMAVLPATVRLNLRKAAQELRGDEVSLATEDEFRSAFPGCEVGAMPPFGNLFGMDVVVDRRLEEDSEIVCVAGTHTDSLRMRYADYKRLVHPRVADLAD